MKDTVSDHNDQETLASTGVTDTITVLIEEASSALSCGDSNIVQTYREDILRSLKILVDPHQHNNKRTLAIYIASVRNNIGNIRFALHEYETAYSFYETAYRMRKKVFGPINLNTSITAFNAGKCLHCLGRPDRALRYYNLFTKAIFSSTKLMTEETVLILQNIAWAFHQDHSLKHANTFYRLALSSAHMVLGENHKVVSRIFNMLGTLRYELGDLKFALACYHRSLRIEVSNLGWQQQGPCTNKRKYLDILTTLSNMAQTNEEIGNLGNSLPCSRKKLEILKSQDCKASMPTSEVNRNVANTLSDLARVLGKLGRFGQALTALTEVLRTRRQEYGIDHSLVATTLNDMGIAHGSQGQTHLALQCFKESLEIRQMSKRSDSNVSTVLCNIARVHNHNGDTNKALVHYQKVVNCELSRRKERDLDFNSSTSSEILLDALEQLSMIYQDDLADPREAIRCYEKGLRLITEDGPGVVSYDVHSRYLGMAGNTCLIIGDKEKATCFFTETMRVNAAGGLAFNANIKATGYYIHKVESDHLPSAPAA
jgi:tetratricopeptide (TPR) repeat protein